MYVDNTLLDKPLPNDLLTSIITANISRGINYNKIDDKEVMRPMTDLEIRVIIFNGIIAGNDTVNHDEIGGYQCETIIRINIDGIHNNEEYWEEPNKFYPDKWMIEG
ncbi:unnamed protein product [Rhizophagus irregularis]|nr:unnamed protein product [Rhizophagus irregularis]